MKTIWLVPLEKIETRYTSEWYEHIPQMIKAFCARSGLSIAEDVASGPILPVDIRLVQIEGCLPIQKSSTGAFINFASTNVWKSSQLSEIAEAFYNGYVKAGDVFYFTDSWNPSIIQVRYMSDLLDIPVKIVGQWHAGWHDPYDFLGRKINSEWAPSFEAALFYAIDINLFTTHAYINLFFERLAPYLHANPIRSQDFTDKILRCGYPNSYLVNRLAKYKSVPKERIVLFPHRLAPEKQVGIFKDLEACICSDVDFVDVKFIACQEQALTKSEYHELLGRSKVVFSAALQETYGIAQTEAVFAGSLPLSPDRLSYSEMYAAPFLYPSEWTADEDSYREHRESLVKRIKEMLYTPMTSYDRLLFDQAHFLMDRYIGDVHICQELVK